MLRIFRLIANVSQREYMNSQTLGQYYTQVAKWWEDKHIDSKKEC